MKKQIIVQLFCLLTIGALHGCGGGSGAEAASSSASSAPISLDISGGSNTSNTTAPPVADAAVVADGGDTAVRPQPTIRRALDTVNPVAASGDLDIELSTYLATAETIAYTLEDASGTVAVPLSPRTAASGTYFPNTPTLVRLAVPATIAPGTYTLKAKGRLAASASAPRDMPEATLTIAVNALLVKMATLTGTHGSQTMSLKFETAMQGRLYVYPLNRASETCRRLTGGELASVANAGMFTVPSMFLANEVAETADHGRYLDSDTVCAQFIRSGDSVAEAPYTFNLRWLARPSGDAVFSLEADPLSVAASSLSLMSVPSLDWADRRQIYTAGDVHQQTTSSSDRISLVQSSGSWAYRLTGILPTDEPAYIVQAEGKPPIVYTLN